MDAVKYLETRKRMSLSGDLSLVHLMEDAVDPEVLVREVERWSASHPLETRQSVFLKQYPEAPVGDNGILRACPTLISAKYMDKRGRCDNMGRSCDDCKREFWMQEVE